MKINKILSFTIISILLVNLIGCRDKTPSKSNIAKDHVELTIYNLFDEEDIFTPIIQAFRSENRNVSINYRMFNDTEEYRDLIINELAQGEGPDIFFLHNSWFIQDYKKLTPAPESVTKDFFDKTFVDVTTKDLIIKNNLGEDKIYSFPLFVDNLALYYNKEILNDKIAEQGRPSKTWDGIQEDVLKLKKEDNSFERFKLAGIAMGRGDNISRGVDILFTLMLQYGAKFYNEDFKKAIFGTTQGVNSFGKQNNPGLEALNLYTSFGQQNDRNYTWNGFISDPNSNEKEIETFARGKVAMIIGYSYLYEEIARQITILSRKNTNIMDVNNIKIVQLPQVFSPEENVINKATLASYFTPAVARTSKNPDIAWQFIEFLTNQENARFYNSKTHKPTARRDLIEEQKEDPIYGVFVKQLGFSKSIQMPNAEKFNLVFSDILDQVIATIPTNTALKVGQERINSLINKDGLYEKIESDLQ